MSDMTNNQFIHHPRLSQYVGELSACFESQGIRDHIILFSSGTTSKNLKGYAFTLESIQINAQAVNHYLDLSAKDQWGLALPEFHIGGYSVLHRSELLGKKAILFGRWVPGNFCDFISDKNITVTSLVPTQLYDLVALKKRAPANLNHIIIGGDFLGRELESQARQLGWPIVKSFGMTEVASQLGATREPYSMSYDLFDIHQLKVDTSQRFWVKSKSLFSYEFSFEKGSWLIHPASQNMDSNDYFPLQDMGEISSCNKITPQGRLDHAVKRSGKLVDITSLRQELDRFKLQLDCWNKVEISIQSDERRGARISLLFLSDVKDIISVFLERVPEGSFDDVLEVSSFERTDLGKLKTIKNI
jgi:O-succinylbenzoic acid--CoA ligase